MALLRCVVAYGPVGHTSVHCDRGPRAWGSGECARLCVSQQPAQNERGSRRAYSMNSVACRRRSCAMKRRSNSSRLPPCPKSLGASERHGDVSIPAGRGVRVQGGDVCLESRVLSSAGVVQRLSSQPMFITIPPGSIGQRAPEITLCAGRDRPH